MAGSFIAVFKQGRCHHGACDAALSIHCALGFQPAGCRILHHHHGQPIHLLAVEDAVPRALHLVDGVLVGALFVKGQVGIEMIGRVMAACLGLGLHRAVDLAGAHLLQLEGEAVVRCQLPAHQALQPLHRNGQGHQVVVGGGAFHHKGMVKHLGDARGVLKGDFLRDPRHIHHFGGDGDGGDLLAVQRADLKHQVPVAHRAHQLCPGIGARGQQSQVGGGVVVEHHLDVVVVDDQPLGDDILHPYLLCLLHQVVVGDGQPVDDFIIGLHGRRRLRGAGDRVAFLVNIQLHVFQGHRDDVAAFQGHIGVKAGVNVIPLAAGGVGDVVGQVVVQDGFLGLHRRPHVHVHH